MFSIIPNDKLISNYVLFEQKTYVNQVFVHVNILYLVIIFDSVITFSK